MSREKKIIIAVLIIFIAVPVVWWLVSSGISTLNSENRTITDRDTGESFIPEDNDFQTGGSIAKQSDIQLFGIENLSKVARDTNGDTGGYLTAIKEALWNYSDKRLSNSYPSLTIRPQGLTVNDATISGSIRLGQSDTIVPFISSITPGKNTAITKINTSGEEFKGEYIYVGGVRNPNELLFTITQKSDTSTELVVNTVPGYREAALEYIATLGYRIPDFSITFTNYENPFK